MVLSVVDVKIQLEMGTEKIFSNILEPLKEKYNVIIIATERDDKVLESGEGKGGHSDYLSKNHDSLR